MTYVCRKINQSLFIDAFRDMGRENQFSYEAKQALYEYLEQLAEDIGTPVELDIIELCCDWTEYASFAEFQNNYDSEYSSWTDVEFETTVIRLSNDAALIQNF